MTDSVTHAHETTPSRDALDAVSGPELSDAPTNADAPFSVHALHLALNGGGVRVVGRGARVAGPSAGANGTRRSAPTNGAERAVSTNGARRRPSSDVTVSANGIQGTNGANGTNGTVTKPPATRPGGAGRRPARHAARPAEVRPARPGTRRREFARRRRVHVRRDSALHARRARLAARAGRATISWRQALCAGLVCFGVWLLLDAPTLLRSAQAGPLGARRSVAITVLRPIDDVSRALGLSHVVGAADRAMGRHGKNGVLQVEGPPAHHVAARPDRGRVGPVRAPFVFTPLTAPDGLRPLGAPSAGAPLQVLAVGDSLGIDFGQSLVNDLAATGVVHAVLDGHIDTGLSRPDYFDWQGELQSDLTQYQPQAVVVFIGANDPQNFVDGGNAVAYGSQAWSDAYAKRVGTFMQAATAAGARVLWVGMPPMADPVLNAKMQVLNGIYQTEASAHRGVTYFASWPVLSDAQGAFASFLPDGSGNEVQVREPDGTHVSPSGAERLTRAAIAAMDHSWGLNL